MKVMALCLYAGILSGDFTLFRYEVAARVWLTGLRLMRWSWQFSPLFESKTSQMVEMYNLTGEVVPVEF